MIRGCASDRISAQTLHDEREVRECRRIGDLFANQAEGTNVELRLGDGVTQQAGASQKLNEISREVFNVVFVGSARLDLLCDKLRYALREIAVLFSEKRKLGNQTVHRHLNFASRLATKASYASR